MSEDALTKTREIWRLVAGFDLSQSTERLEVRIKLYGVRLLRRKNTMNIPSRGRVDCLLPIVRWVDRLKLITHPDHMD